MADEGDDDYGVEEVVDISGGRNLVAFLFMFVALCIHLVAVYFGYQFIKLQFEKSAATNGSEYALCSCWEDLTDEDDNDEEDGGANKSSDGGDTENVTVVRTNCVKKFSLSHGQAAFVMTTCLWMLMFGSVSHCWPIGVFPLILVVTFFIMAKYYLKGGHELTPAQQQQQWVTILGYLTCCTTFATTAAYLLSLLHARYQLDWYGGPKAGHYAVMSSVVGTIASLGLAVATGAVYYLQEHRGRQQQEQMKDNSSVGTGCETTFTAMKE